MAVSPLAAEQGRWGDGGVWGGGAGRWGDGEIGRWGENSCPLFPVPRSLFPIPDSRFPTPVPLLGGVRGGFRFPILNS
ncbi:MAG: hypothetical protein F6J94_15575 [Moorea sp. SIO1F2]|uniref:hypothetical protein n=1 Tax=Moorena sp. SIO1F2 TaxID=2607819 RepID=UPI0013B79973|nr:hypothetical protein [Moorena sp. SIO1F2]NET83282.1 hypothetical protein [Moorena sp. SIO1F2]